jgi:hypothetical protein
MGLILSACRSRNFRFSNKEKDDEKGEMRWSINGNDQMRLKITGRVKMEQDEE